MKVEVLFITDAVLNGKKIQHAGVLVLCQFTDHQSPVLYFPILDEEDGKVKKISMV